jgi:hypothetical protein
MVAHRMWRVGDWVEVRSLDEILATLDARFCLEGMPFMPEMARYCGHRFRILKSAHKTCDPTGSTGMRSMTNAVHLDTRCDGSSHGGCEARCLLFWKTAWLKPAERSAPAHSPAFTAHDRRLDSMRAAARCADRYCCQTTEIVQATTPLPANSLWSYVQDIRSGNATMGGLALQLFMLAINKLRARLSGRRQSSVARSHPSAVRQHERLDLTPGEIVVVRSAREITSTLDGNGKNRGLSLENEMLRHCGSTHRVLFRVNRLIDERTGKLIELKNECIALDGVTCAGLGSRVRLFCPRAPYFYWRESWLQRAASSQVLD